MSRGVPEHGPEGLDHRLRARHVRVALGVHLVPVADAAERHVLEEAGHDDAVVPLPQRVLDQLPELGVDARDRLLVHPWRGGQDGSRDDVRVQRVVGPGGERLRVGLAAHRAGVREPQPEARLLRRPRPPTDGGAGPDPVGHRVQAGRGTGVGPAACSAYRPPASCLHPVRLGGVGERGHDAARSGRRRAAADRGRRGSPRPVRASETAEAASATRSPSGTSMRRDRGRAAAGVAATPSPPPTAAGCRRARSSARAPARRPRRRPRRARARRGPPRGTARRGTRAGHRRSVGTSPVRGCRRHSPAAAAGTNPIEPAADRDLP